MATLKERIKAIEKRMCEKDPKGVDLVVVCSSNLPEDLDKNCLSYKNQLKKTEKGTLAIIELRCETCLEKCRFKNQPKAEQEENKPLFELQH